MNPSTLDLGSLRRAIASLRDEPGPPVDISRKRWRVDIIDGSMTRDAFRSIIARDKRVPTEGADG
jgi:hypothetical protein